jgi:hypothetical protein
MTVSWTWTIEAFLGGSWVDISPDVLYKKGIRAVSGLTGSAVTDRVASPGALTYFLNNAEDNSAKKLGYYSADNANLRTGFGQGMKTRLKLVSGANTRYVWNGRVTQDPPMPNQFGDRETSVTAVDYMDQFSTHKLNRIPVQTATRTDQILTLVVANLPIAPLNTSYDTGPDTFDYALQDEQDEKTYAITAVQKACQSDLGYVYVRGNTADGETLVYESRNTRVLNQTSQLTLDNAMSELVIERKADNIFNNIHIPVTPAVVDAAATTVLATNPTEILLNPGQSQTVSMRFVDPTGAGRRISGIALVDPPVADTDWKFSSVSGNGGNDLNANLSVTFAAKGGNTADVLLVNNGAVAGYVQKNMQIRGKGVYLYDTSEALAGDTTSQNTYGDRTLTYQIPYQGTFHIGQDFANELNRRYRNPFTKISSVMFYADVDSTLMAAALTLDIGGRITLKEAVTGISADFYINGRDYTITPTHALMVRWILEAANVSQLCILDDPNHAVLNTNAYLAF